MGVGALWSLWGLGYWPICSQRSVRLRPPSQLGETAHPCCKPGSGLLHGALGTQPKGPRTCRRSPGVGAMTSPGPAHHPTQPRPGAHHDGSSALSLPALHVRVCRGSALTPHTHTDTGRGDSLRACLWQTAGGRASTARGGSRPPCTATHASGTHGEQDPWHHGTTPDRPPTTETDGGHAVGTYGPAVPALERFPGFPDPKLPTAPSASGRAQSAVL